MLSRRLTTCVAAAAVARLGMRVSPWRSRRQRAPFGRFQSLVCSSWLGRPAGPEAGLPLTLITALNHALLASAHNTTVQAARGWAGPQAIGRAHYLRPATMRACTHCPSPPLLAHTNTHARACAHTHTHACTHARTLAHTQSHSHTHPPTLSLCLSGGSRRPPDVMMEARDPPSQNSCVCERECQCV